MPDGEETLAMPPTKTDFLSRIASATMPARSIDADLLKVAAVKATDLTGHPGWDDYLSHLQAMLNTAEAELATWTENCCNALSVDDMRYAQRNVTQFKTQITVLKEVMQLPGKVIETYNAT